MTALRIRDQGGPHLRGQLLIYPATDLHQPHTESALRNGHDYLLTLDDMIWFGTHYLNAEPDGDNPYTSPLLAPDLHGLPPALVVTAEYDPLLDEGAAYAQRLQESGVPTVYRCWEGMIHGFFNMSLFGGIPRQALDQACQWLKDTLKDV